MPIDASVNLSAIARMKACENFSGADLAALVCLCSPFFCRNLLFFLEGKPWRKGKVVSMWH
jgi:hypothetical protein